MMRLTVLSMSSLKKALRILILCVLIILASVGVGIFGLNRDPYIKNENPVESVVKKEEEDEDQSEPKEVKA